MLSDHVEGNSNRTYLALWALIMFYAAATILPLFPGAVPFPIVVASEIIPAAVFALIHGAKLYRLRGILVFAALCLVIGNVVENIGVLTGFPFGRYYFTERMGPKLFLVPVLIGPAYLGMGYLSWVVARLILGKTGDLFAGARVVTVPIIATFIMVAWDLAIDPTLSTIGHYWIWLRGGAYFGVPLSNFLGWYLTNYLIYQSFALYLRSRPTIETCVAPVYWRLAVLFYTVVAIRARASFTRKLLKLQKRLQQVEQSDGGNLEYCIYGGNGWFESAGWLRSCACCWVSQRTVALRRRGLLLRKRAKLPSRLTS